MKRDLLKDNDIQMEDDIEISRSNHPKEKKWEIT